MNFKLLQKVNLVDPHSNRTNWTLSTHKPCPTTNSHDIPRPNHRSRLSYNTTAVSLTISRQYRSAIPANMVHSPNAVSMLGQRQRQWANIEAELAEYPVFAGMSANAWTARQSADVFCRRLVPSPDLYEINISN